MTSHHICLSVLPPRITPLFQLCLRCASASGNADDRPGPKTTVFRPCSVAGKTAASRRCHYKIRV